MTSSLRFGVAILCLAVAGSAANIAFAAAGGTRSTLYVTRDVQPDLPRAQIRFDDVLYALNTVQGKYKVFPLMLESRPDGAPVTLSREKDVFTIKTQGQETAGILDLAKADPALWDGLETRLKEALLYPAELQPDDTRIIYILAPASGLEAAPEGFSLYIDSLGRTLDIPKSAPMAE